MALHVTLNWTDPETDVTGFVVARSSSQKDVWVVIATLPPTASTFNDTAVSTGQKYDYRINAVNPGGNSPYALAPNVAVVYPLPAAPTNFVASVGV